MPHGLQTWNNAGGITLDTNTRLGSVLGSVDSMPLTGSYTDPQLLNGDPFFITIMSVPWRDAKQYMVPIVTVNGATISWRNAGTYGYWRIVWGIR